MLRHRLWKAPQAIFTMSVAPATLFGERSTFIEKSPQGSPHVQTCTWPVQFCICWCTDTRTGRRLGARDAQSAHSTG